MKYDPQTLTQGTSRLTVVDKKCVYTRRQGGKDLG